MSIFTQEFQKTIEEEFLKEFGCIPWWVIMFLFTLISIVSITGLIVGSLALVGGDQFYLKYMEMYPGTVFEHTIWYFILPVALEGFFLSVRILACFGILLFFGKFFAWGIKENRKMRENRKERQ